MIKQQIQNKILDINNLSANFINEGNFYTVKGDTNQDTKLNSSNQAKCYVGFINLTVIKLVLNKNGSLTTKLFSGQEPNISNYFKFENNSDPYTSGISGNSSNQLLVLEGLDYQYNNEKNNYLVGYGSNIIPSCKKYCARGFKQFGKETVFDNKNHINFGMSNKINDKITISTQHNFLLSDLLASEEFNGSGVYLPNKGLFGKETQTNSTISLSYNQNNDSGMYACMNCEVYKPGKESSFSIAQNSKNLLNIAAIISKIVSDKGAEKQFGSVLQFKTGTTEAVEKIQVFSNLDYYAVPTYILDTNNMNCNYTQKAYKELNDNFAKQEKNIYFTTMVAGYKKKCGLDLNATVICNSKNNVRSCNVNMNNYTNFDEILGKVPKKKCFDEILEKVPPKKCFDAKVSFSLGTPLYVSSGTNKDTNIPIVCELGLCMSLFGFNIPVFIDRLNNIDGNNIDGWVFGINSQSITQTGKTGLIQIKTNRCCD